MLNYLFKRTFNLIDLTGYLITYHLCSTDRVTFGIAFGLGALIVSAIGESVAASRTKL